jgi:hypothetical protein
MQYKIKFFGLKSATYNVPLHINKQLNAAQTPADILQVIVDNEIELSKLNDPSNKFSWDFKKVYDSETIAELMSEVLTSKGIEHTLRIAEDLGGQGHEVLYYIEVKGMSYHYPFKSIFYEDIICKQDTLPIKVNLRRFNDKNNPPP